MNIRVTLGSLSRTRFALRSLCARKIFLFFAALTNMVRVPKKMSRGAFLDIFSSEEVFCFTNQSSLSSPVKQDNPEEDEDYSHISRKRERDKQQAKQNTTTSTCCCSYDIVSYRTYHTYPLADTREN